MCSGVYQKYTISTFVDQKTVSLLAVAKQFSLQCLKSMILSLFRYIHLYPYLYLYQDPRCNFGIGGLISDSILGGPRNFFLLTLIIYKYCGARASPPTPLLGGPCVSRSRPDQRRDVPVHGQCSKEGYPKFNPRPGRGLNPGRPRSWQSEILPTALTLHTHVRNDQLKLRMQQTLATRNTQPSTRSLLCQSKSFCS